jgi:hypothetical protein
VTVIYIDEGKLKKATDNVQITDPSKKVATAVFHLSHIKMSVMGSLIHTFK